MEENKSIKVFPDFENELKAIDSRLSIVPNPNPDREKLANIKLDGVDICPIPKDIIYENPDVNYGIVAPNGWKMRHKSRSEALGMVMAVLEEIKNPDGYDVFFNK